MGFLVVWFCSEFGVVLIFVEKFCVFYGIWVVGIKGRVCDNSFEGIFIEVNIYNLIWGK